MIRISISKRITLKELKKLGYKIVGTYRRNKNYIYLKRDKDNVAISFSLNDKSYNPLRKDILKEVGKNV